MRILQRLTEAGEASPSELADALAEPLGNVSYHVRVLRELDCLELVHTETRRGALEHFYRAKVSPWLSAEQWARLPTAFRQKTLARTLAEILKAAAEASLHGGFDGPETYVRRVALAVDGPGAAQLATLLDETRDAALRINAESVSRQAEQSPGAPLPIATELALIHLRAR